ncbi:MAG: hypothetical protein ACKO7G_04805, partial [Gammaproteobacteria bacterium]
SDAVLPSVTLAALRDCGVAIGSGELRSESLSADGAIEGLVLVSALRLAVAIREVDGRALPTAASLTAAAQWRAALLAAHAGVGA